MRILRLTKSRRGSAGITYGLAVGLIAVVAVTATQQVGGAISGLTNGAAGRIKQAAGGNSEPDIPAGTVVLMQGTCPDGYAPSGAAPDPVEWIDTSSGNHYSTNPTSRACEAMAETTLAGTVFAAEGSEIDLIDPSTGEVWAGIDPRGWLAANGGPTPAGITVAMRDECPTGWIRVDIAGTQYAGMYISNNGNDSIVAIDQGHYFWCGKSR